MFTLCCECAGTTASSLTRCPVSASHASPTPRTPSGSSPASMAPRAGSRMTRRHRTSSTPRSNRTRAASSAKTLSARRSARRRSLASARFRRTTTSASWTGTLMETATRAAATTAQRAKARRRARTSRTIASTRRCACNLLHLSTLRFNSGLTSADDLCKRSVLWCDCSGFVWRKSVADACVRRAKSGLKTHDTSSDERKVLCRRARRSGSTRGKTAT